jgi:hypothetical protein
MGCDRRSVASYQLRGLFAHPCDWRASPRLAGPGALLSEVVTSGGEHHLVLVVRTKSGDLVLGNMAHAIRQWSKAPSSAKPERLAAIAVS